jgi:hypothetical protein
MQSTAAMAHDIFWQSGVNPAAAANDFPLTQGGMFYLLMSVFAPSFVSKGSRKGLV